MCLATGLQWHYLPRRTIVVHLLGLCGLYSVSIVIRSFGHDYVSAVITGTLYTLHKFDMVSFWLCVIATRS